MVVCLSWLAGFQKCYIYFTAFKQCLSKQPKKHYLGHTVTIPLEVLFWPIHTQQWNSQPCRSKSNNQTKKAIAPTQQKLLH